MRKFIILLVIVTAIYGTGYNYFYSGAESRKNYGRVYLNNGNIFDGKIKFDFSGKILIVKTEIGPFRLTAEQVKNIEYENGSSIDISFLNKVEDFVADKTIRAERYSNVIKRAAYLYDVEYSLINAVINQESRFYCNAVSPKGASGLMQLMPETAKHYRVNNIFDPVENIEAGTRHLSVLLKRYNGNKRLALAAYNAGTGAVRRYQGIPPYSETINYVKKIMKEYDKIKS